MTLYLHGVGHFHPPSVIDNAFLRELDIGCDEAWVLERVGIHRRRSVLPLDYIRETHNRDPRAAPEAALVGNAEMGRAAAEMALQRAGLRASDIGLVIAGSCAPDTTCPAEACAVAAALGIDAPALDVSSGCTSPHAALHLLSLMQPARLPAYVLLVTPEAMTRVVDYGDRATAALWGDAAVAAVVSTREASRIRIRHSSFASRPAGHEGVRVPRTGHFGQRGRVVQRFAITHTLAVLEALQGSTRAPGRAFHFVGHQANAHMLANVCTRAAIPDERHHSNVAEYGNTGGAGSLSVVSARWRDWAAGDDVAVVGVGAGLSWSGYLLRFGGEA